MTEGALKDTEEVASASIDPEEAVNVSSEAELTSLQQTQGKRDFENEIASLKLEHDSILATLRKDYERKIKALTSEHLSKTDQLEKELREERNKCRQLSNKNSEVLMGFDKRVGDEERNQSERNDTHVEEIRKLRVGITERQASSDERLENLEKGLEARLAEAFGSDCREISVLTSAKKRLEKELEDGRSEIQILQIKLDEAIKKIEEKKVEMKGQNDDLVKLLCDRHEDVVSKQRIEMDNLRSAHQSECSALKTTHENEKQQLKDEYDNFKRDFKESQQGQQDDILRQKDEDIRKFREQMRSMEQRHRQELCDKDAVLKEMRVSDREKIAELEASKDQLQHEIQENDTYFNELLAKHIETENQLRNEIKELENKIYL